MYFSEKSYNNSHYEAFRFHELKKTNHEVASSGRYCSMRNHSGGQYERVPDIGISTVISILQYSDLGIRTITFR